MLNVRAAGLKERIMAKLEIWIIHGQLQRMHEVPSESLLEDVNATLRTMSTATITETKQLIYSIARVILGMTWLQAE